MADIKATNKLFEKFHPRARVLPLLTLAFFVGRGAFPRTLAFELYTRPGLTGDDARKAYGAYKTPGHARAMTLGGLAATNTHITVPVTMWPVVYGTWDDPSHPSRSSQRRQHAETAATEPWRLASTTRPRGSSRPQARQTDRHRPPVDRSWRRPRQSPPRARAHAIQSCRSGSPTSIFISYAHADQQLARALCEGLKAHGHRVWIDDHELRVGDSLIERIATAIADIDFFLPLLSPAAAHSRWPVEQLRSEVRVPSAVSSMVT
jgi:hypothetical protein